MSDQGKTAGGCENTREMQYAYLGFLEVIS